MGLCKPPHSAGLWRRTTTYGYDAFGSRVFQTTATSTTIYPFKWYSVASSTGSGATYATTTEYVFNGKLLLATVDQQTAGGVATGTPQTSYIHPDHLGSTNVVTNASGTVVQTLDYYPYGSTRINTSVGGANSARKYIGLFSDDATNLIYANARYLDPNRGQFLSQDPVFWEVGLTRDGRNVLANPQALTSYGYANGNPITNKDAEGRMALTWNSLNVSAEAGLGAYSYYGLTLGLSLGRNDRNGEWWIAPNVSFSTGTGDLGGQKSGYPIAKNSDQPFVTGIYGGITALLGGVASPSANTPDDLAGPATQSSLNPPLISITTTQDLSRAYSYGLSAGIREIASVSKYPVQTWVPASYNISRNTFSMSSGTAAAINRIQSQINSIRVALSKLIAGTDTQTTTNR